MVFPADFGCGVAARLSGCALLTCFRRNDIRAVVDHRCTTERLFSLLHTRHFEHALVILGYMCVGSHAAEGLVRLGPGLSH